MRRARCVLLLLACSLAAAAHAADWRAVPGTTELEMDADSLLQQRNFVRAWVRFVGRHPLQPAPGRTPRPYRSVLQVEFDCRRATLQTIASQGFDSGGRPLFMSSEPGPVGTLPREGEVQWLYDAVCEMARGPKAP